MKICSVPGCEGKVIARGMCNKHYQRVMKGYSLPVAERMNQDAFRVLDERAAYFLGVLYGDGWLKKKFDRPSTVIGLKMNDEDVMRAYAEYLGLPDKLKTHVRDKGQGSRYWSVEICTQWVVDELQKLGLTTDKSYSQREPQIPENLYRHFIRGLIDSDGCIEKNKVVRILVTHSLIDWLQRALKDFELSASKINSVETVDLWQITIKIANGNSIRFLDWIYSDSTVYGHRKYNRYLQIKDPRVPTSDEYSSPTLEEKQES